ncbi:uncharacterized protein LOC116263858 [Nymphaea colorata]|uniref:uncharacterized protein LOC116263858 n=1 Tax=Nymphaea colorata TaxID=210225 RepID=UPI00129EF7E1|nr:uncharacterized protein LOC116263858 [Nymphaea colorata]
MEGEEKSRSTSGGITLRLFTVFAVAAVSVWANHEASKGFDIHVSNEIADATSARRFHMLFVADDRIDRMVLSSSRAAERLLYGENAQNRKKVVKRVSITVRLSASDQPGSTAFFAADAGNCAEQCFCYTIYVGSGILREKEDVGKVRRVVGSAVQKVMAYVWLSDGDGRTPAELLDGIADYVTLASVGGLKVARVPTGEGNGRTGETNVSGSRSRECWLAEDPGEVAAFIGYCECMSSGFVARLNEKMAEGWRPEMVDEALGTSSMRLCSSFSSALALASQSTSDACPSWRTWTQ